MRRKNKQRWQPIFLKSLTETCSVRTSVKLAGISRSTAYRAREADAKFAEDWDDAVDDAVDNLEAEARRRALHGIEEPVFYLGKQVGTIRRYSDSLIMFLLKAYRPERFREVNLDQLAELIARRMGPSAGQ